MDFFHGIVALLAFVVLILTALVAWMYIQQTRIMQAIGALTSVITAPPREFLQAAVEYPVPEKVDEVDEVDDRVSVHDDEISVPDTEVAEVTAPAEEDDDLGGKTVAQLRELLNGKGIPFNKSDKKPILVNLLKAAS